MIKTPATVAALLLGVLLLAAPAGAAGFCTALWAPVCGAKGGVETTYSNPGCAKVDGAEIVRQGRCEDSPPPAPVAAPTPAPTTAPTPTTDPDSASTPAPTPSPTQIFCTEDYAPVCGVKDGTSKTYPNACHARADGASVSAEGECPKP